MLERKIVRSIGSQELLRMPADARVTEAAQRMAGRQVGAMPVCEGEATCGIFTDRDMPEWVAAAGLPPGDAPLSEANDAGSGVDRSRRHGAQ